MCTHNNVKYLLTIIIYKLGNKVRALKILVKGWKREHESII